MGASFQSCVTRQSQVWRNPLSVQSQLRPVRSADAGETDISWCCPLPFQRAQSQYFKPMAFPGRGCQGQVFSEPGQLGCCLGKNHITPPWVSKQPRAGHLGPHPSLRACHDIIHGPGPDLVWGHTDTCFLRPDSYLPSWTRPRAHGPASTSGRAMITCPDPAPQTRLLSRRASRLPFRRKWGDFPFPATGPQAELEAGRGSRAVAAAGAVMAELVQGQSAPVGMKAEGFVDALHRVRQVRVRPAGGSTGARGGAGPGPMGRRGSGLGAGGSQD